MAKTSQEKEIGRLSETARIFNEITLAATLPAWADNIAHNMEAIRGGRDVSEIPKRKGEPALVIAAGPSLKKRRHLKLISKSKWSHPIITCDRNLVKCMTKKIVPYCVCSVDASPKVANFYKNQKLLNLDLHFLFSVAVHPKAANTVYLTPYGADKIHWFIPFMDDAQSDPTSLTRLLHFMTHKSMLMVGGNVGTFCWNVAMYLGCNPVILVGFDLSYDSPDISKSIYYKAFLKKFKGDKGKTRKLYAMARHPVWGNKYVLDPIFKSYRDMFRGYAATAHKLYGLETINATEGGGVFGEGITCTTLKEVLKEYA